MSKKSVASKFLRAFSAALEPHVANEPALAAFISQMDAARAAPIGKSPKPLQHPMLDHLPGLLGQCDDPVVALVAQRVGWLRSYESVPVGPGLAAGLDPACNMLAAQVSGSHGLVRHDALNCGLFLLGPGVHYPLHDHVSEEIYYVLAGSVAIQNGFEAEPRNFGPGAVSHTPPGLPHSLTTGCGPVLIQHAWIGEVVCDVFWWQHVEDGTWHRYAPARNREMTPA